MLAAHVVSGCDTVATYFGIGKSSVLKVLKSGKYSLSTMGDPKVALDDIYQQASQFVLACY